MSHGCTGCFKHLKRNCKCNSPKQWSFGYRTRLPEYGNTKKWKLFIKDYLYPMIKRNPYRVKELLELLKGTKLENVLNNLIP